MPVIVGVDVAERDDRAIACAVVMTFPGTELVRVFTEHVVCRGEYVPGQLYKREGDAMVLIASRALSSFDNCVAVFIDGMGMYHPSTRGLATFVGERIQPVISASPLPVIGIGKNPFTFPDALVPHTTVVSTLTSWQPVKSISDNTLIYAYALSVNATKPIFVSVGYGCTLIHALELTRACARFRIPEPIRWADHFARKAVRELE